MAVTLHCYTSTRNDLYMLRYYVRHWARYAAKIFVYDDDSTDGSREFLASCAPLVEIKSPGFSGIDEIKLMEMRAREYRIHSRGVADWVVIGDCDEMHYHPRLLDALAEKRAAGFCAVVSHGWHMFSESPPTNGGQITDLVKRGIPSRAYNRVIFDPLLDVTIGIGHHAFKINDGPELDFNYRRKRVYASRFHSRRYRIEPNDPEFKNLHYRFLGEDYLRARNARNYARISEESMANGWGRHQDPGWTGRCSIKWYLEKLPLAEQCIE